MQPFETAGGTQQREVAELSRMDLLQIAMDAERELSGRPESPDGQYHADHFARRLGARTGVSMTDPRTVEGCKERAAERGAPDRALVKAARTAGDSLGNPAVVERLVQGSCHRLMEFFKWRRTGQIDADELVAQIRSECTSMGAIFMGGESPYVAVPGWNSPRGIGVAITVLLGGEAVRAAESPAAALFEWLAAQLMSAYLEMAAEGASDVDAVGARAQASITSAIDTLLGVRA